MEPSSPPWRVFDAPSGQQSDAHANDRARGGGGLAVQPLAVAALGASALLGGLALVIVLGGAGGVAAGPEATGFAIESSRPGDRSGQIVVDVTGAVVTPGVYRLAPGARVGDAIDAAGGFSRRVDADRVGQALNLAASVADGEQVRVPSRDDPTVTAGTGHAGGGSQGALIDLNSASQTELESLPGIGPVTAGKIIEARSESPFRSVEELRERGLVGEKTFDSLRALITVG